jgi:hypothetical protein
MAPSASQDVPTLGYLKVADEEFALTLDRSYEDTRSRTAEAL